MLMAIGELFRRGWVEWVSAMTYQAASGAGANNMRELIKGMGVLRDSVSDQLDDPPQPSLRLIELLLIHSVATIFPSSILVLYWQAV